MTLLEKLNKQKDFIYVSEKKPRVTYSFNFVKDVFQKVVTVSVEESYFNSKDGWMGFVNEFSNDPSFIYQHIMKRESSEN